ncbi:MAG: serine/threonine protein kinase [Sandaracinaceae bacterium]|nr:serine/threonine protein kinase [Sandaracinaceae bacterium]
MPGSLRAALESQPIQLPGEFDFEDVGPTQVVAEQADDRLDDVPLYEPFRAGKEVGRYRIERMLGRGATGVVYEASHVVVGRRVALKCLFPHMAVQPVQVQRLFREAKIAATVEHPNVVQVFDGGRDKDTYYLAMEMLEGRTFAELIEEGRRPVAEIADIMKQVMSGVAAVHDEGVVHRDLKPDNIFMQMIPEDPLHMGIPKVLDFGVSKLKEPGLASSKLTAMGMVMGTPYYMAPEQVADTSGVDQRADVFSLGVILYEALSGELPYKGHSVIEIFTQAQEGRPTPIRELRPEVPPSLEALIARAMCPDKEARFASVHEMRAALEAVPFDAEEPPEEWADVSQPWMLDKSSGVLRKGDMRPMEVEPTQAMAPQPMPSASMPTPLTNPRPPVEVPPPVVAKDGSIVPLLAVAALLGGLLAAAGAALLYFLLA